MATVANRISKYDDNSATTLQFECTTFWYQAVKFILNILRNKIYNRLHFFGQTIKPIGISFEIVNFMINENYFIIKNSYLNSITCSQCM